MSNFQNIKMVSQPHDLKVELFPHQLASIYKMEQLEINKTIETENYVKHTRIGINCDVTGYGKTLSMIGLMVRDKMEWDLTYPHVHETIVSDSRGLIKTYTTSRYDKLPTNLILVTQSIIGQWEKELQKSNLKYRTVICNRDVEELEIEKHDVILVSPSFYNKLAVMNSRVAWKRFIFDEPGNLKIAGMQNIQAGFYWFMTATPLSIYENHKNCKGSFMRDLFYFHNFHNDNEIFLNDISIKNNPDFVRESFTMPPTEHIYHRCYQPIYNAISCFVSSTIKTMVEAGNIEGAIFALGGTKTSNIMELIREKKNEEIRAIDERIAESVEEDRIRGYNEKKQHILNQIAAIDERFRDMLNDNCIICCEKFKNPVLEPNCQNLFCGECLLTWLQRKDSCPTCRVRVNPRNLIYVEMRENAEGSSEETKFNNDVRMTKLQKVLDIIENNESGKFLVFSEYDSTFYPMCDALREKDIGFMEMKGSVKTRERNIELFKTGKIPVLFLNSTYNAAGINLTEATDIILCHQMTESQETQIIGRANRIGRTQKLKVHHLLINT
jgi:SNF2 family DNA or RNA helicase